MKGNIDSHHLVNHENHLADFFIEFFEMIDFKTFF